MAYQLHLDPEHDGEIIPFVVNEDDIDFARDQGRIHPAQPIRVQLHEAAIFKVLMGKVIPQDRAHSEPWGIADPNGNVIGGQGIRNPNEPWKSPD